MHALRILKWPAGYWYHKFANLILNTLKINGVGSDHFITKYKNTRDQIEWFDQQKINKYILSSYVYL